MRADRGAGDRRMVRAAGGFHPRWREVIRSGPHLGSFTGFLAGLGRGRVAKAHAQSHRTGSIESVTPVLSITLSPSTTNDTTTIVCVPAAIAGIRLLHADMPPLGSLQDTSASSTRLPST